MAQLADVNTTDIPGAVRLACETMQRVFNPQDGNIAHFSARAWPPHEAGFAFMAPYTEAHVPGRHLLALLEAEDAFGACVSEEAIENHRRAVFLTFSGPVNLPLSRTALGGEPTLFVDHNLREAFHAFYALARFRDDAEARELAERCIQAVFDLWDTDNGWDVARIEAAGAKVEQRTFIWGPARSIGPLVKYYRTTGHGRALELALVLAEKVTSEFFLEGGGYESERFGTHTHSATCTLSSLAQLADLLGDTPLMGRVRAFYDNGLRTFRDDIGWVWEHAGAEWVNPDRGEINNTGDIVETALILGRWGWPEYYADAERMLRCHLLPAQLRDVSFIGEPPNPDGLDGKRDVAMRMRGAWGFPAPYGHQPVDLDIVDFCLDIVGGGASSLCEAWREAVRSGAAGHWVTMLFDREDPIVSVESPYTHEVLCVTPHRPGPLWVRIPQWVDREALIVEAKGGASRFRGDFAFFPSPTVDAPIAIRFGLTESALTLRHSTRDIRVRLHGDQVAAMDTFGADFTFFPSLSGSRACQQ